MRQWQQGVSFSRNAKSRREKRLRQLAQMRAAKERKRQARIAAGLEPEPKMERWYPLEFGVRDKRTLEVAWTDFKSVRDAAKRLSIIKRFY